MNNREFSHCLCRAMVLMLLISDVSVGMVIAEIISTFCPITELISIFRPMNAAASFSGKRPIRDLQWIIFHSQWMVSLHLILLSNIAMISRIRHWLSKFGNGNYSFKVLRRPINKKQKQSRPPGTAFASPGSKQYE